MDAFRITVGKEELGFAAAHFIAYEEGACEPLHGHNYRVAVTLTGPLNAAGYVFDFVALKRRLRELLDGLDHRVLLPEGSERIRVSREGEVVRATCGERRYAFPAADVRMLPVEATTSELLAVHLADEVAAYLSGEGGAERIARLEVEVEESPGQSARHARELAPGGRGGEGPA